jgi:Tfp pilus assembly protein PilV
MHTFLGMPLAYRRRRRRRFASARTAPQPYHRATAAVRPDADDGFLLIEVLISALLVALIVVATFNGFDVANRVTADQRHHDQAALLAAQSQEQLRSDPASALDTLESAPHTFSRTIEGTTYTTTQEAKPINASGGSTGCKFSETTAQNGAYIQIITTVSWPQVASTPSRAIKQSSLVTPPTGSDLEVDVSNGATPPAGVSGVTATATFIPDEAETQATIEGTTGPAGCVVLTGIPSTSATVSIAHKPGFVTPNGQLTVPPKELTIAPNITTHYPVTYNEAGKITAEYTYEGLTSIAGKPVQSDTFVAYNVKVPAEPKFEVGSPEFEYKTVSGEEEYKALTTVVSTAASTPHGTTFAAGDLFPFSEKWQVYPGDCPANSIEAATSKTEKLTNPNALVEPGKTAIVKVPLSKTTLNVKSGTESAPGSLESAAYSVTITDAGCSAERVPNNATAANLRHAQTTSSEGHLTNQYQPFGKYELCLSSGATKRLYKATNENTTVKGSELTIYPGELTAAEYKSKEETARSTWKSEETAKKITNAERKTKESTQTTEREKREKEEEARPYKVESGSSC